jgi:peptidoglycan/LPS O-acetylase OafA/YrhL
LAKRLRCTAKERARVTLAVPALTAIRITYIDGLRALAVVAVLISHVTKHLGSGLAQSVFNEGAHGVDLFFVISGFCLALPTLAKLRAGAPVRFDVADFAAKRLVRIVPPFYCAVILLLALAVIPHLVTHHALPPPNSIPDGHSIAAQLLFLDDRIELVNGSFWTLMVELRWYFAFPVLLWLWVRSPRAFLAIGVASFMLYHLTRARGLDFGTLPGFMLGIIAADLQVHGARTERWGRHLRRWAWTLLVPALGLGIACEGSATIPGFYRSDVTFAYQPTILGWQVACFAFVVFAGENAWFRRILSLPALVATGIASYGIYLVHAPVVDIAMTLLRGSTAPYAIGVLALAAGFAFWAVFERPFTTGGLRAPLLAWTRPWVDRAFALAGVSGNIQIRPAITTTIPQETLTSPASPLAERVV